MLNNTLLFVALTFCFKTLSTCTLLCFPTKPDTTCLMWTNICIIVKKLPLLRDLWEFRASEDTTQVTCRKKQSTLNTNLKKNLLLQINCGEENLGVKKWCSVWHMYQCSPNQVEGERKREKSRVGEITPGGVKTTCRFQTPAVIQEGLEGLGERAEAPRALPKQKSSHVGQRHHQDDPWNLGEKIKTVLDLFTPRSKNTELFVHRASGVAAQCTDRRPEKLGQRCNEEASGCGYCPVEPQYDHQLHREQEEEDATYISNTLQTKKETSLEFWASISWTPHTCTFFFLCWTFSIVGNQDWKFQFLSTIVLQLSFLSLLSLTCSLAARGLTSTCPCPLCVRSSSAASAANPERLML